MSQDPRQISKSQTLRLLLGPAEAELVRYIYLGGDTWNPVDAGSFQVDTDGQRAVWTWQGRTHRVVADQVTGLALAEPSGEASA